MNLQSAFARAVISTLSSSSSACKVVCWCTLVFSLISSFSIFITEVFHGLGQVYSPIIYLSIVCFVTIENGIFSDFFFSLPLACRIFCVYFISCSFTGHAYQLYIRGFCFCLFVFAQSLQSLMCIIHLQTGILLLLPFLFMSALFPSLAVALAETSSTILNNSGHLVLLPGILVGVLLIFLHLL